MHQVHILRVAKDYVRQLFWFKEGCLQQETRCAEDITSKERETWKLTV